MQVTYRAIFTEMLTAQAAAVGTLVDVSARCIELVEQQCQALAAPVAETGRGDTQAGPSGRRSGTALSPANFYRAVAGLPRFSLMSYLSHYDDLRGRRRAVGD